jgi:transcriptional regulator with XRE-family HTH domain
LAYRAGITKNAIQLLEAGRPSGRKEAHGTSNPRFSTLAGIAEVLGLKVSALLAEADL